MADCIRQDPRVCQLRLLGSPEFSTAGASGVVGLLAQPKSLAVLVFIALAPPPGFRRRDHIVAMFWPEHDQPHARGALRRILHVLRDALGSESLVKRGAEEIGVDSALLLTDVAAFDGACAAGCYREALALYRGDLLEGFFVAGVSCEFEHWLDRERQRLKKQVRWAAERLAEAELASGNLAVAAELLTRAVGLFPDDEPQLRRLLRLLSELGDGAGANRLYQAFAERIAAEYDARPAPETQALIAAIRSRTVARVRSSAQSFAPLINTVMTDGPGHAPLMPSGGSRAPAPSAWSVVTLVAALIVGTLVISTLSR